jgi:hypothetical protein
MSINRTVASRITVASGVGLAVAVLAAVAATTAYAHKGHGAGHAPQPTSDEIAAFEKAKPAFERHCFRCHTATGKKAKPKALVHIAMDSYPFGGHHANEGGSVVRDVLGTGGGKPTMPSDDPGSVGRRLRACPPGDKGKIRCAPGIDSSDPFFWPWPRWLRPALPSRRQDPYSSTRRIPQRRRPHRSPPDR